MDYRKKVLEHFGSTIDYEYQAFSKTYDIEYSNIETADGFDIYRRYTGPGSINWDTDVFYYAESCLDEIVYDITEGNSIYVYDYIAEECGLEEDGYMWEELYNKYIGNDN